MYIYFKINYWICLHLRKEKLWDTCVVYQEVGQSPKFPDLFLNQIGASNLLKVFVVEIPTCTAVEIHARSCAVTTQVISIKKWSNKHKNKHLAVIIRGMRVYLRGVALTQRFYSIRPFLRALFTY